MLKIKLWHIFLWVHTLKTITGRKLCFNPVVHNIFNRFVYKLITLPAHILVSYFQRYQTVWDNKSSITFDRNMIWISFWCPNIFLDIEQYVEFKMSFLISQWKSLIARVGSHIMLYPLSVFNFSSFHQQA